MSLVYLLCTLGLGLFISTISRHAAAGDDDHDVLLPDADDLPVGLHLPDREHAAWIQPVTYLIPLRYFLVIVRGIFLKGVGLEAAVAAGRGAGGVGPGGALSLAVIRSRKRAA